MCDVATVVAIGSTVSGAVGQYQTSLRTSRAALNAQRDANAGLEAQQHQADQQATEQMVERSRRAVAEIGQMNAIFADTGVSGNTHDRLVNEAQANADADLTTIERNRQNRATQNDFEGAAIQAQAQARINSAPRPSIIGTGLQIASDYYKNKPKGG